MFGHCAYVCTDDQRQRYRTGEFQQVIPQFPGADYRAGHPQRHAVATGELDEIKLKFYGTRSLQRPVNLGIHHHPRSHAVHNKKSMQQFPHDKLRKYQHHENAITYFQITFSVCLHVHNIIRTGSNQSGAEKSG